MAAAAAMAAPAIAQAAPSIVKGIIALAIVAAVVVVVIVIVIVVAVKTKSGYFTMSTAPLPKSTGETWGHTALKFGNYTVWG